MDKQDERITAWETIAKHPFFADVYDQECSLIEGMVTALDRLKASTHGAVATQAEEPIEWRLLRAFTNGHAEGLRRGIEGRFDR